VVFTAAINACATPIGDEADRCTAFELALLILEELKYSSYGQANFLTYAAFFRACATTSLEEGSEERDAVVRRVFVECRNAGQVGQLVLRWLKSAATPDLFNELVQGVTETSKLPRSWTRQVKGERRNPATSVDSA
jgi:hypothetical protein